MCFFSSPSMPSVPEVKSIEPPDTVSEEAKTSRERERKRAQLAKGRGSTILTGGAGDMTQVLTGKKRLLGQ